ncbi:MAG TPA: hypothetical protein VM933_04320 [Acidimicrobiales bacterium]|nr:hypothetical protein [Acidimicrobiales bacterium]
MTLAPFALLPPVDVDGPKVRLGLAWAAVTTVAALAGAFALALVFAAVALGAAGQATRTWRRRPGGRRPYRPVAVAGAVVCALAGAAGPLAVAAAAVVSAVAAFAAQQFGFGGQAWDARSTTAIAVLIGAGAAAPSLVVDQLGVIPALVLLLTVHAVDAGTFVIGSGASRPWEGPLAGAACAAATSVAVAAIFVPPFRGASPWVLGAVVALLVPAGAMAASTLLGARDDAPVPALRRLDAYLVTGPVWALLGRLLLDVA